MHRESHNSHAFPRRRIVFAAVSGRPTFQCVFYVGGEFGNDYRRCLALAASAVFLRASMVPLRGRRDRCHEFRAVLNDSNDSRYRRQIFLADLVAYLVGLWFCGPGLVYSCPARRRGTNEREGCSTCLTGVVINPLNV